MVDYDFYVNAYLGSAIPEKAFSGLAARALDHLQRLERCYTVGNAGAEARKMALCAMAEELYAQSKRSGVTAATVGNVSVRYGGEDSCRRLLYEKAAVYLDFCRGVGV